MIAVRARHAAYVPPPRAAKRSTQLLRDLAVEPGRAMMSRAIRRGINTNLFLECAGMRFGEAVAHGIETLTSTQSLSRERAFILINCARSRMKGTLLTHDEKKSPRVVRPQV